MKDSYFDNMSEDEIKKVRQNIIDYLKREMPSIYGDLKDEIKKEEDNETGKRCNSNL